MGLSDYLKLVPFTLKIRQSRVREGHQSGACATTHGSLLLLLRDQRGCVVTLLRWLRLAVALPAQKA